MMRSLNKALTPTPVHYVLLRTSRRYRALALERKRLALGAVNGLPSRYAQLPPLLTERLADLPHDVLHSLKMVASPAYRRERERVLLSPDYVAWVRSL